MKRLVKVEGKDVKGFHVDVDENLDIEALKIAHPVLSSPTIEIAKGDAPKFQHLLPQYGWKLGPSQKLLGVIAQTRLDNTTLSLQDM